jgi:leucine dehydrogenase
MDRGILYAPDFVINAGGLINVYSEMEGYNRQNALSKTENIYHQTLAIFETAKNEGISTLVAAQKLAERRIEAMANLKTRR